MSYNTVGIIKNGVKQKLPVVMVAPKVDGPDYVEVVADGTKTYSTLLNELFALVDNARVSHKTIFEIDYGNDNKNLFVPIVNSPSLLIFTMPYVDSTTNIATVGLSENGSTYKESVNNTITNNSSQVPASGRKLVVYYDSATIDLTTRASNCVYDNSNSGLSATEVQGAIDEVAGKVASVTYPIENNTSEQLFSLPTGFTSNNCTLIAAKCFTKYNSFVDSSYDGFTYFGAFSFASGDISLFKYTPKVAGNSTSIIFTFMKI